MASSHFSLSRAIFYGSFLVIHFWSGHLEFFFSQQKDKLTKCRFRSLTLTVVQLESVRIKGLCRGRKEFIKKLRSLIFCSFTLFSLTPLTQCLQLYLRGKTINFPQKKNQNNLLITILSFTIICFYVTTEPPCSLSSSSYIELNNTFIFSVISFFFTGYYININLFPMIIS